MLANEELWRIHSSRLLEETMLGDFRYNVNEDVFLTTNTVCEDGLDIRLSRVEVIATVLRRIAVLVLVRHPPRALS